MEQMMERLLAEMRAGHKEMMAGNRAWQKEMKANQEVTEAYPEKMEANPEEMKSEAEHQQVPKAEAEVEIIGALKEQYGDRHLAVKCRRQLRKQTQGDGGSQKKLTAAH
jgi:hypothetical protein